MVSSVSRRHDPRTLQGFRRFGVWCKRQLHDDVSRAIASRHCRCHFCFVLSRLSSGIDDTGLNLALAEMRATGGHSPELVCSFCAQLILFALIACLGCFLVWSKGMSLQQDIQVIADSISNSTAEMNALSVRIIQALDDAKMFTYEAESEALAADTIANISEIDEKMEEYMEVGLSAADVALVIAAVMGLSGIVLVLTSLVGKWRWFTYLTGFLTLSLVCSWLFWGILTGTTTLLADFQYASAEYSVSQKFGYTFDSDLENALPCMDGKDVVKLMNTARMSIAAGVYLYNDFIQMYDPKTLPLIDQEYDGDAEAASKYCAFDRPGDDYYTAFCDAYVNSVDSVQHEDAYIKTQKRLFQRNCRKKP